MSDELALLDELLAEDGFAVPARARIPKRPPGARVPLAYGQELLWLIDRASPGLSAYNVAVARRLCGDLNESALERALGTLAARHEALRTRFALVDGEPAQIVDPPQPVRVQAIDLRGAADGEAQAARLLAERARIPFDLARAHPLRVALVRLGDRDRVLMIQSHHIVLDGGSLAIFLRELGACYAAYRAGREPELPPLAVQYGDYACWQRKRFSGDRLRELLAYWRERLGPVLEPLALSTDFPRVAAPSFAGGRVALQLQREVLERLLAFARERGATLYMLLLAAYATVLHRYTGRTGVLVGSGAAARAESETEHTVGYFTDMLVQRIDFTGDPAFSELLERVRDGALDAYEHQGIPLEKLSAEFGAVSLFDVVLTPQDTGGSPFELAGLDVRPFEFDVATTKFDLALLPARSDRGLRLTLNYRSELFLPATMERLLGHVARVLDGAVAAPDTRTSALPLLTPPEERALAAANATKVRFSFGGVLGAFEAQARRVPERAAVICGDDVWTYAALQAESSAVARRLRAAGVPPGSSVGISADRRAATVAGFLGILQAGAAYVPLPEDGPAERLRRQLVAGAVETVLGAGDGSLAAIDASLRVIPLETAGVAGAASAAADTGAGSVAGLDPGALAYVLFTSGSSGTPKGVAVTHGNLSNYTGGIARVLGDVPAEAEGDGFAALDGMHFGHASTLAADLGNTVLWTALCAGATLHLLPAEVASDAVRFAEYVARRPLDVLKTTPSHFRALSAGAPPGSVLAPRRWLVAGGEPCPWSIVDDLRRADAGRGGDACRLLNHYGPTETTVGAATFEVTSGSARAARAAGAATVPIGLPLANVALHVVDARLAALPVGVPGELLVSGAGVARGYIGGEPADGPRFLTLPGGLRAYRTGDRVRRLATGELEFLGRFDAQVKLRGFRIELGEIEAALASYPGVEQAAVALEEAPGADARLVAHVCAPAGCDEPALRAHAAGLLPGHMLPAAYAFVTALPLTPNGKVDRRALPALGAEAGKPERARRVPRTQTERTLVDVWAEAFKRAPETLGAGDDFLALGGHSLLAIRILGKVATTFGVRLSLRTLFAAPTVEALAREIDAAQADRSPSEPRIGRDARAAYAVEAPVASAPPPDREPARAFPERTTW